MRIVAALLALALILPMTGWMILSAAAPDCCLHGRNANACAMTMKCSMPGMPGMKGMSCPMMAHAGHGLACTCQVSGTPRKPAIAPIHAVAPEPPQENSAGLPLLAEVSPRPVQPPHAGYPGLIDHPPSPIC